MCVKLKTRRPWQWSSSTGGLTFILGSVFDREIKLFKALERGPVKFTGLLPRSSARYIHTWLWTVISCFNNQVNPVPYKGNWEESRQGLTSTRKVTAIHSLEKNRKEKDSQQNSGFQMNSLRRRKCFPDPLLLSFTESIALQDFLCQKHVSD